MIYRCVSDSVKILPNADEYCSVMTDFSDRDQFPIVDLLSPAEDVQLHDKLSFTEGVLTSTNNSTLPLYLIGPSIEKIIIDKIPNPSPGHSSTKYEVTETMAIKFLELVGFFDEKKEKAKKKQETFKLPKQFNSFTRFLRSYHNVLEGGKMATKETNTYYNDPMEAYMECDWLTFVLEYVVDQINSMNDLTQKKWHLMRKCCIYLYLFVLVVKERLYLT